LVKDGLDILVEVAMVSKEAQSRCPGDGLHHSFVGRIGFSTFSEAGNLMEDTDVGSREAIE